MQILYVFVNIKDLIPVPGIGLGGRNNSEYTLNLKLQFFVFYSNFSNDTKLLEMIITYKQIG